MSSHQALINALKSEAIWTQPAKDPYLPQFVYRPLQDIYEETNGGEAKDDSSFGKCCELVLTIK